MFKYLIILTYIFSVQATASDMGSGSIAPLGQRIYVVDHDLSKPTKILSNESSAMPGNVPYLRDPAFLGQAKTSIINTEDAGVKSAFSNTSRSPSRKSTSTLSVGNPSQRMKVLGKPLRPQIMPEELKLETSRANIPVENRILENLYHSDQNL